MAKISAPLLGESGKVDLDAAVFGETFHMSLVHEAVTAELNARRQGTHSTRTRGEIAMTGAKAWRQKGTGRARAGALSTPNRYGGGVAFGPKPRHYISKVNRKARRRALRSALSVHADRGTLAVFDAASYETPSTKAAANALAGFGEGRALVVCAFEGEDGAVRSFRNIDGVKVMPASEIGIADIIGSVRLVISKAALDELTGRAGAAVRGGDEE